MAPTQSTYAPDRGRAALPPMQSLAVIGRHAADLAGRDTNPLRPGSAFERIWSWISSCCCSARISRRFRCCITRAALQCALTAIEGFYRQVRTPDAGKPAPTACRARPGDRSQDRALPGAGTARKPQPVAQRTLNYGRIAACRLVDFTAAVNEFWPAIPGLWSPTRLRTSTDD